MNLTAQYFNSPCRVLKTIHESPRPGGRDRVEADGVGAGIARLRLVDDRNAVRPALVTLGARIDRREVGEPGVILDRDLAVLGLLKHAHRGEANRGAIGIDAI
jgi:hypothetical protein